MILKLVSGLLSSCCRSSAKGHTRNCCCKKELLTRSSGMIFHSHWHACCGSLKLRIPPKLPSPSIVTKNCNLIYIKHSWTQAKLSANALETPTTKQFGYFMTRD